MAFELANLYVTLQANTRAFNTSLSGVHRSLKKVGAAMESVRRLGRRMFAAGAGISGALGVGVKAAASFQQQLAFVSTMLDEQTMSVMPKFRDGVLKMSAAYGEGTATLTQGLYDILSASVPVEHALNVLDVSARAAAAGMTDTGVAADAITTILNSYSLSAENAADVSDLLFAIVKRGKITFDQLAPQIGRTAALSAMAGVSLEDMGSAIATMTRSGIRARLAVTALNGILRSFLTKSAPEAEEAALKYGIALNTATIRAIGLTGVIKRLNKATDEEVALMFPALRGLIGIATALQNAAGFAEDYDIMLTRAGRTEEAFAKVSNTLTFEMKRLWQMARQVAVAVGDVLIPSVTVFAKGLQETVAGIVKWIKANPELIKGLSKLAVALMAAGAGLIAIGTLFTPGGILAGIALVFASWTGALDGPINKIREFLETIRFSGLFISEWLDVGVSKAKSVMVEFMTWLKLLFMKGFLSIQINLLFAMAALPKKLKKLLGFGEFGQQAAINKSLILLDKFVQKRIELRKETEKEVGLLEKLIDAYMRLRDRRLAVMELIAPAVEGDVVAGLKGRGGMSEILAKVAAEIAAKLKTGKGFQRAAGGPESLIWSIQRAAFEGADKEQIKSRKKNTDAIKALTAAQKKGTEALIWMKKWGTDPEGAYLQVGI